MTIERAESGRCARVEVTSLHFTPASTFTRFNINYNYLTIIPTGISKTRFGTDSHSTIFKSLHHQKVPSFLNVRLDNQEALNRPTVHIQEGIDPDFEIDTIYRIDELTSIIVEISVEVY